MPSTVYYGSARQAQLTAQETLPAKLELILEKLELRERVKDETVAHPPYRQIHIIRILDAEFQAVALLEKPRLDEPDIRQIHLGGIDIPIGKTGTGR